MKTIYETLKEKKSLIGYLMTGDPSLEESYAIIETAALCFDVLELGVPFSDPIADGPIIQAAAQRALRNRITISDLFSVVRQLRQKKIETPILPMLYYNLVLQYGVEKFIQGLLENGLSGCLIPDLPYEESESMRSALKEAKLEFPMLITPTTNEERAKKIVEAATGFIYYVSYTGTTGSKQNLDFSILEKNITKIKKMTDKPVAVGFGVKDKESVKRIFSFADAAIVGSALIDFITNTKENKSNAVKSFVEKLIN